MVLANATRVGRHVLVALPREQHARVVTIDEPRESGSTRWALHSADAAGTLAPRFQFGGPDQPVFVDALPRRHHGSLVVFEAPDGVSLHEILTRTDLQSAVLDPAVAMHIVVRALLAAGAPRTGDVVPPPPIVDAGRIRVGWSGAVCFLGRLPNLMPPVGMSPSLDAVRPWVVARFLVERVTRDVAGGAAVVAWMHALGGDLRAGQLARDPGPWREAAMRVADLSRDPHGAVDDVTLAGITRSLFPDDYGAALDATEQLAMLDDDELRAVPESDS